LERELSLLCRLPNVGPFSWTYNIRTVCLPLLCFLARTSFLKGFPDKSFGKFSWLFALFCSEEQFSFSSQPSLESQTAARFPFLSPSFKVCKQRVSEKPPVFEFSPRCRSRGLSFIQQCVNRSPPRRFSSFRGWGPLCHS